MVTVLEYKPSREGLGEALLEIADQYPQLVAIGADTANSTSLGKFAKKYPERFVNVGIAEQNAVGIAVGLSLVGKLPVVSTYAMFLAGRCWEEIRQSVCYNYSNVKLVGTHAGLTVGPDGASHQILEDIALMRVLPNMSVIVPSDANEAKVAVKKSLEKVGAVYIRLSREKLPVFTSPEEDFVIGKAKLLREGSDCGIISCGVMVYESLVAAEILEKQGINCRVINMHTVKPIDTEAIIDTAKKCGCIVTCEEHQVYGGLGSAVAEVVIKNYPVPQRFVGIKDKFGESGSAEGLMLKYGLKAQHIVETVKEVIKYK
ncbi:MAG: transketolase family protein [Endomicrobia bacterium]|nr:transketolase family protein [Endomicrobiia bacterium]